jgi:predicted enzyme related to lactoylglutathione lyase
MAQVLGLGGIFFKAPDPAAVSDWYGRVLGFPVESWGGAQFEPSTRGVTMWSPFKADSDYFDPSPSPWMLNLIVDDLDGVLALALAADVEPIGRVDDDPNGRFAWLIDPMGVKIELWEPAAPPPV